MGRIHIIDWNQLACSAVENLTRTECRNRIELALNGSRVIVKLQRSWVAPFNQKATTACLEKCTGVANVKVQLFGRSVLSGLLVKFKRLLPSSIIDDRLHRSIVEVEALGSALRLNDRRCESLDCKVGLGITLLEDTGTEVALTVTIHVLAMNFGRHLEIVFPGLRRLHAGSVENVLAVIDHLEVAIDHQQLGLTADLLAELAEIWRNVVKVDLVVLGDVGVQILK